MLICSLNLLSQNMMRKLHISNFLCIITMNCDFVVCKTFPDTLGDLYVSIIALLSVRLLFRTQRFSNV